MVNPVDPVHPVRGIPVDDIPRPVVGVRADFEDGERIPTHRHRRAQLVHAASGVMTVTTVAGAWVVPPERAVWVPGGVDHGIRMSGTVSMRTAYLAGSWVGRMPGGCCVVPVSPLLRELLLRVVEMPQPFPLGGPEERLAGVLIDELRGAPVAPLHLPRPTDGRARKVADALMDSPEDARDLEAWARLAGASPRTLGRVFRRETGMSLGTWRRQRRLLRALERLAAGEPVTRVALDLGYGSTSAFIAMFRRSLGCTPGAYFRSGTPS